MGLTALAVLAVIVGLTLAVIAILATRSPKTHDAGSAITTPSGGNSNSAAPLGSRSAANSASVAPPAGSSPAGSTAASTPASTTASPVLPLSSAPPSAVQTPPATTPSATAQRPALIVLNKNSATNSDIAAGRFRQGGWPVSQNGPFTGGDILSTAAFYDPGVPGAESAARALQGQFPAIKRVVPKFPGLPDGPIVIILANDYS